MERREIILASGSLARRQMLASAGVTFVIDPAAIDEAKLLDQFKADTAKALALDAARFLAQAKALDVSSRHPGAFVIGSDQILALGDRLFSKAADPAGARVTLLALKGRTHQLHSAVAIAFDNEIVWAHGETASLTMRTFSDAFLERYLDEANEALVRSVGAYELEGLGLQLFERVEGDYFTILGMPMLPLLAELRARGALPI